MNRNGHERFVGDPEQERHWHKPVALLSMTSSAIKQRRWRRAKYAAEVDAIRTIKGVKPNAPIGPVLREELWAARAQGAGLSLLALAARFKAIAAEEGVSTEEIAARYEQQQVRPHRQRAGERLAALVVTDGRPDWVDPDYLVQMIEPPENGTPNPAYAAVVRDEAGAEWVLVRSYDGSEPMAWPHDEAGLKGALSETLDRVRAANQDGSYQSWLDENNANENDVYSPWNQSMTEADFLANSGAGGMHLT